MSILCQELCYWFSLRMFYFLFTASQEKSRIKRSLQRETSAKVNALSVICPIVIEMCWVELGRILFSEKKVKNAKMHFERLQNARTATKWSVGFTSAWTFRKGVSCKPLHMALFVRTQMKIIRTAPSQLSPQGGCPWWPCLTLSAPVPSLQETCTFLCPESPAPSKPERLRCLYIPITLHPKMLTPPRVLRLLILWSGKLCFILKVLGEGCVDLRMQRIPPGLQKAKLTHFASLREKEKLNRKWVSLNPILEQALTPPSHLVPPHSPAPFFLFTLSSGSIPGWGLPSFLPCLRVFMLWPPTLTFTPYHTAFPLLQMLQHQKIYRLRWERGKGGHEFCSKTSHLGQRLDL